VGEPAALGEGSGDAAGADAVPAGAATPPDNDLMNAINCTNWSSETWPWNVGMIG
jgi:hypothetical protein